MKQPQQSKTYKVTNMITKSALDWPGHFGGALSLNVAKLYNKKPVEMLLTTLDGWMLMRHDGALAVTNGVIVCTIDETETKVDG